MPSESPKSSQQNRIGHLGSWIISSGMLVSIGSVLEKVDNPKKFGIIISRSSIGLGIYGDKWNVLVSGRIITIEDSSLWPLDDLHEI